MQQIILRSELEKKHLASLIRNLDVTTPWHFTWKPYKSNRSLDQNNLYWKWIAEICAAKGWGKNVLHDIMMHNFITPTFEEGPNGLTEVRRSTTKLNTREMSEYMEKMAAWAATDLGVFLSFPQDLQMR